MASCDTDQIHIDELSVTTATFTTIVIGDGPPVAPTTADVHLQVLGDMDVTGVIDPTGIVLSETSAVPFPTTAGKGTLWVDDTTSPHKLKFNNETGTELIMSDAITSTATVPTDTLIRGAATGTRGVTTTGVTVDGADNMSGVASLTLGTPLTVPNGGTGVASITADALVKGAGAGNLAVTGVSVDGSNNVTGVNDIGVAGDAVITGNLTVNGTTTTVSSQNLLVEDNYICLNKGYDADLAQTGGIVLNIDPDTSATVNVAAGGFVAGVAAVSNPVVVVDVAGGTFSDGDFVIITGANTADNDGIFEILSHAGSVITIRGVGTTPNTVGIDFAQNQFTTDVAATGRITLVRLTILKAETNGEMEYGSATDSAAYIADTAKILRAGPGGVLPVSEGGTGVSVLPDNQLLTGGSTVTAEPKLLFDGNDLTFFDAVNDGNPTISLGAAAAETLVVETVYDGGAQTLDCVNFTTKAASGTADKGKMVFNVDETAVVTIRDAAVDIEGYVEMPDVAAPANPGAGRGRLYKKTGDDGLFWKPDGAGPEVDLTDTGSGASQSWARGNRNNASSVTAPGAAGAYFTLGLTTSSDSSGFTLVGGDLRWDGANGTRFLVTGTMILQRNSSLATDEIRVAIVTNTGGPSTELAGTVSRKLETTAELEITVTTVITAASLRRYNIGASNITAARSLSLRGACISFVEIL